MLASWMPVRVKDAPVSTLDRSARSLEVLAAQCEEYPAAIRYDRKNHRLSFIFDAPLLPGTELHLAARTRCRPSSHILEGLYYDETPGGAPPTQITQCSSGGSSGSSRVFDDMSAKCTHTEVIFPAGRYPIIIAKIRGYCRI